MAEILREKGSIFCVTHPKTKLVVLCDKCYILICHKCLISKHSGHSGTDIEHVAEVKFRNIDDFIIKTESSTIPDLKQNFQQVEARVKSSLTVLQAGVDEVYEHEKYLIALVKRNTKETVTQLKSEIQNINQQFSHFQIDSDNLLAKLEAAVNECKQTKRSENDILMIDVADGVQELGETKLTYPTIKKLNFISGTNAENLIQKAFGYITQDETKNTPNQPSQPLTLPKPYISSNKNQYAAGADQAARPKTYLESKPTAGNDQTSKMMRPERLESNPTVGNDQISRLMRSEGQESKPTGQPVQGKPLLSNPAINHSLDINCSPNSIEVYKDGTICFCEQGSSKLKLLNPNGKFQQLDLHILIKDIAIHPATEELYAVCGSMFDRKVRREVRIIDIHSGASSVVFTIEHEPDCIAFSKDNNVLVGFTYQEQVTMYTIRGDKVKTINVPYNPEHITVSPVTGDVAVVDVYGTSVYNNDLQRKYRYRGSTQHKPALGKLFISNDAVYDTEGHLLTGDRDNKEVHICEANTGKLLKTINLTEFGTIRSLALLSDGTVVVGTSEPNKLVFVKYI